MSRGTGRDVLRERTLGIARPHHVPWRVPTAQSQPRAVYANPGIAGGEAGTVGGLNNRSVEGCTSERAGRGICSCTSRRTRAPGSHVPDLPFDGAVTREVINAAKQEA